MKHITLRKGLDLPYYYIGKGINFEKRTSSYISVAGIDYPFKPRMVVEEGAIVRRGDFIFTTKEDPRIGVVSPVDGKILGIQRGSKRSLISVSIEKDSSSSSSEFSRQPIPIKVNLNYTNRTAIAEVLAHAGAWVYLRTRPFAMVPKLGEEPSAIFINAMDTRPGSVGMKVLLSGRSRHLQKGIEVLGSLTSGPVYFCQDPSEHWDEEINTSNIESKIGKNRWQMVSFAGAHPAGLSSTHIHFLHPVSLNRTVWTIPVDLVADIGEFWTNGILPNITRVSMSGPYWKHPTLIECTLGSRVSDIVQENLPSQFSLEEFQSTGLSDKMSKSYRIVAGSILHGWEAKGDLDFLGRFHNQISILLDHSPREFLDWLKPGTHKYSITRTVIGRWLKSRINWSTSSNGSSRSIVPIGNYERVMPMDILPTQLLRALVTEDWEEAIELGALELEEEDLSLLTYVCPGKKDYGSMLLSVLKTARKELV